MELEQLKEKEFFRNLFDSELQKCTKQDFIDFQDAGGCKLCGTQRCYGYVGDYKEHVKSCGEFKKFLRDREKGGS